MVFRILPLWDCCDEGLPPWCHLATATPGEIELAAERFAWGRSLLEEEVSERICWLARRADLLFKPPADWPPGSTNWGLNPLQSKVLMILARKKSDRLARSVHGAATLIVSQVMREDARLTERAHHFLLTSMGSIQNLCLPQNPYETVVR